MKKFYKNTPKPEWSCNDTDFDDKTLAAAKKLLVLLYPKCAFTMASAIVLLRMADEELTYRGAGCYINLLAKLEGFEEGKGKNLTLQEIRCRVSNLPIAAKLTRFIKYKTNMGDAEFNHKFSRMRDCKNCAIRNCVERVRK